MFLCLITIKPWKYFNLHGRITERGKKYFPSETVGRIIRRSAVWTVFNGFDIPMGVRKNHAANNCKIPSNHQISYDDFNDPILRRTLICYWKMLDIYLRKWQGYWFYTKRISFWNVRKWNKSFNKSIVIQLDL